MPRRLLNVLIANLTRVKAERMIAAAAVADHPHLSAENREAQLNLWKSLAGWMDRFSSVLDEVLWTGELTSEVGPNTVIAEDFEQVESFFEAAGLI